MTEFAYLAGETDPRGLSPLTLAFIGDGVYELMVRTRLLGQYGNAPAGRLHSLAVGYVRAQAQSDGFDRIEPTLTEEELAAYRRGRNSHSVRPPKNCDMACYRKATGLEALFGWLYLTGQGPRIQELFAQLIAGMEEAPDSENDRTND